MGPELAALALSAAVAAGGSMYNADQQQRQEAKASSAASKATLQNLKKQRALAQQSRQTFSEAIQPQSQPVQQQNLDDATAARTTAMTANLGPATADYAPAPSSAPKVVQSAQDTANAKGRAKVDKEAAALAKLGAFGDVQQGNRIALNRAGGKIAENNSFVQGQANLLPMQQNTAVNKVYSKPLSPLGDIAQTAGAAGVMAAYPQADMPSFADVLGLAPAPKRKVPRNGLGEMRG